MPENTTPTTPTNPTTPTDNSAVPTGDLSTTVSTIPSSSMVSESSAGEQVAAMPVTPVVEPAMAPIVPEPSALGTFDSMATSTVTTAAPLEPQPTISLAQPINPGNTGVVAPQEVVPAAPTSVESPISNLPKLESVQPVLVTPAKRSYKLVATALAIVLVLIILGGIYILFTPGGEQVLDMLRSPSSPANQQTSQTDPGDRTGDNVADEIQTELQTLDAETDFEDIDAALELGVSE